MVDPELRTTQISDRCRPLSEALQRGIVVWKRETGHLVGRDSRTKLSHNSSIRYQIIMDAIYHDAAVHNGSTTCASESLAKFAEI